jgi:hypothetical protein
MNPQRKRPLGITLLALPFLWIGCMGTLIFPIMIFAGVGRTLWESLTPSPIHSNGWGLFLTVVILMTWLGGYLLYAFLGYGLWKLRRWALKGATIVQFMVITVGLVATAVWLKYQPLIAIPFGIALIAPPALILWYLKRSHVQAAFDPSVPYCPISAYPVAPTGQPAVNWQPQSTPKNKTVWKYVVIGVVACVVLLALFVSSLFYGIDKMFRSSDVYRMALEHSQKSPCVVRKLGSPLATKGLIEGNMNEAASEGSADLQIPVRGPKDEGSIHVVATKSAGHWEITSLTVFDNEGQIQLLPVPSDCQ